MSGGVEPPVQIQLELNWCMLEGLLEVTFLTKVVVLTISVSLTNQRTSFLVLELLRHRTCMELNMKCFGNIPSANLPLHNLDVPCVVCYVATRVTLLMIP